MIRLKSRRTWVALLAGLLIVGLAASLRLWQLGSVPAFFHFDEGNNGADALRVLAGEHALFFGANRGREGLIIYGVAGFTALLGRSMLAARLTGALASTLAVAVVFWLGSILFASRGDQPEAESFDAAGRWRGLAVGALGAGVMAASLGLAIVGRTGLRANFLPLLLPLAVALLWKGMQRRSNWRLAAAGAITGLLAYTYISARFFPVLLLLWGASFYLPGAEGGRPDLRVYGRRLALYAGVSLLVALPMIVYFALHPADFSGRSNEVWLFNSQLYDGNALRTLLHNTWLQLSVLGFAGDPSWRSNYAELPLLHPVEALFFWLGVGALLRHWRLAHSRLLLLWLAVFLAPAVLSYDLPRNTFRMSAMGPAIYLALGYGYWIAASGLVRLASRRSQAAGNAVLAALIAAAALLVGLRTAWSADLLFNRWAHEVGDNVAAPNVEWVEMMQTAGDAPATTAFVVPISEVGEYAVSSFDYLYQGDAPVHLLDSSLPDFVDQFYDLLRQDTLERGLEAVAAIDWAREGVADAPQRIPFLLNQYGRLQTGEERTEYELDTYTDLDLETPWQLYTRLEARAVALDGGISLIGIAAGVHGGDQVDLAATPLPAGVEPAWLVLRWKADQLPKADYSLSLRLFDAAGATIWQQDSSLVDDLNRPTSTWEMAEVVESYHTLALPPDLPAGRYELRAIVYDEVTLTPIVQVGVWTPEIVLAEVER